MSKETTRGVIAILSVIGILFISTQLLFYKVPPESKDFFLIILTFLVAKIGTVFDFFFGSSQGSATKNETIASLAAITPAK